MVDRWGLGYTVLAIQSPRGMACDGTVTNLSVETRDKNNMTRILDALTNILGASQ